MIALDTTFLVDYLDGVEATQSFLEEHDDPIAAPSLALFEVYRGAARAGGVEAVDRATTALDWVEPLPLDDAAAREAAAIEAGLLDGGNRINLGDVLVAGICRHHGASIVTRDDDYDRVDGVDSLGY